VARSQDGTPHLRVTHGAVRERTRNVSVLSSAVATNPELEARLVEKPEIETFLVYGDWLSEHGDPRGELVAVQAKLLADPGERELREREARLLAAHRHEWLGQLACEDLHVTWFCGFIEHARIGGSLPTTTGRELPATLAALLALPGIDLLRSLVIQRNGPTRFQPCLDILADHAPRGLRALELACPKHSASSLGDLAPLARALPRLRRFSLESTAAPNLAGARFPVLRDLVLDCAAMATPDYEQLARFESLERLELVVGSEAQSEDIHALLGYPFPNLRHLALRGMAFGDRVLPVLAESPLVRRLESLDLSTSDISAVEHLAAFAHLAELDLSKTLIPPHVCLDLERAHAFVTADASRYYDESYDDVYDY
jgi:uncharacterized protein (TIGR02996 family)